MRRQSVMQDLPDRVNRCIVFNQRGHAVIGRFQNKLMSGPGGGQLCSNTCSHGFAVKCNAIGWKAGCGHIINQQRIFIECGFGKLAGAFAKSRIIGHPYFIAQIGEIGRKAGIPTDVFSVAMKIEYHAPGAAGSAFELNDIEVAVLGEVNGSIQVRFFKFVIMLPAQGNGVQEDDILNKIKCNTAGHIGTDEDDQPADQSFFQFEYLLALQRLVFCGKKEPRQPGRGSQWDRIWKTALNQILPVQMVQAVIEVVGKVVYQLSEQLFFTGRILIPPGSELFVFFGERPLVA